ncbi:Rha family transcriptional regulator [Parabacteroides distasonis]|jgi:phage regulator Rha-like protein|uniref:Uncharacterized phage-encoded protein n=1 Tax=Parabacteroides distasonis TaxID=823 RepID=A0A173V9M2_PARDI|nr:Rha family transcriptional regulator [Parabacteroides distasonis]CUN22977.1 Uncharacterized phage-encoded protein [Parabacteroides distasonis]
MNDVNYLSIKETMSSLEIAETTGKEHKIVMRDIRNLIDNLNKSYGYRSVPVDEIKKDYHRSDRTQYKYLSDITIDAIYNFATSQNKISEYIFKISEYIDKKGETRPKYELNKKACLLLASGYNIQLRAKIIDRWEELELEKQKAAVVLPQNYIEALEALIVSEKQKQALQAENIKQKEVISHKSDVIEGLTEDIELAEKRQRITQIVRYNSTDFQKRYRLLYKEFELKYHMSLNRRINSEKVQAIKPEIKNKIDYIDRVLNIIPELYEIACKIFETDVKKLIKREWKIYNLQEC